MSLPQVLQETIDRLVSRVGGAVLIGFVALGLFNQATQSPNRQFTEEELPEAFPEQFVDLLLKQQEVSTMFSLGLPGEIGAIAWVVSLVAAVVMCILAVRGFGRDRFGPDRSLSDGLGWASLRLVGAAIGGFVLVAACFIILGIVAMISTFVLALIDGRLALLVFPLLVLGTLVLANVVIYAVPAVAIDDHGVIASLEKSYSLFKTNLLTTTVLIVLLGVIFFVNSGIQIALFFTTPAFVTASASVVLSAFNQALLYAALAAAYVVLVNESEPDSARQTTHEQPTGTAQPGDSWTDD